MVIGKDLKRNYYDILCRGILPFDQVTLQNLYENHKARGNDKVHDPMPVRLVFMDDKPEMYEKLLSSLTPLTPMTQAPLLLAGYMSKMEEVLRATGSQEKALAEAIAWRKHVVQLMEIKDKQLDQLARRERSRLMKEEWHIARKALGNLAFSRLQSPKYTIDEFRKALRLALNGARKRPEGLSTKLPPQQQGLPTADTILQEVLKS